MKHKVHHLPKNYKDFNFIVVQLVGMQKFNYFYKGFNNFEEAKKCANGLTLDGIIIGRVLEPKEIKKFFLID